MVLKAFKIFVALKLLFFRLKFLKNIHRRTNTKKIFSKKYAIFHKLLINNILTNARLAF